MVKTDESLKGKLSFFCYSLEDKTSTEYVCNGEGRLIDTICKFIIYRDEIKQPLDTELKITRLVNKIVNNKLTADECEDELWRSMTNKWIDIYPSDKDTDEDKKYIITYTDPVTDLWKKELNRIGIYYPITIENSSKNILDRVSLLFGISGDKELTRTVSLIGRLLYGINKEYKVYINKETKSYKVYPITLVGYYVDWLSENASNVNFIFTEGSKLLSKVFDKDGKLFHRFIMNEANKNNGRSPISGEFIL